MNIQGCHSALQYFSALQEGDFGSSSLELMLCVPAAPPGESEPSQLTQELRVTLGSCQVSLSVPRAGWPCSALLRALWCHGAAPAQLPWCFPLAAEHQELRSDLPPRQVDGVQSSLESGPAVHSASEFSREEKLHPSLNLDEKMI